MGPNEQPLERAQRVSDWYRTQARDVLVEHVPDQIAALDDDARRLAAALQSPTETPVCLVGVSGIGKSTLINSIVGGATTVAPAGGVGPLTALATEVRFSATPHLRVEYHPRGHLWRVASALNFHIARQRREALDQQDSPEVEDEIRDGLDPENEGTQRRMEEFIRMARLMITGSQHEDRPAEYLADALSAACGVKARWSSHLRPEDEQRIQGLKRALAMAEAEQMLERQQDGDTRAFREVLRDHAAGYLSPLIRRIEIGWDAQALRNGLVLVDLPGVGVAGDVYKRVTQRFVREQARAVVIVVDKSGPTDSVMELLRTTGYWDRLLVSSDDPDADPCALVLAVTRVDDLATEGWYNLEPDEEGRRPQSKAQVFEGLRADLQHGIHQQFERALESFVNSEASEDIRRGREATREKILRSLEVHPVSAIEFRRLLAKNEDDAPFLKSAEQTGLPQLKAVLEALASGQARKRRERVQALTERLMVAITTQMDGIQAKWTSSRAEEEAERVREALQRVIDDGRPALDERRSSFRAFFRETVPEKIKVAVLEAKDTARKDVIRYLRTLDTAHWATLRAAVHRGGTFFGARHINLPDDIALRFQDPVAAVWSQTLLKTIRQETYKLASDLRQAVEELCDWASREQRAYVDQKVIDAQKAFVSGQVERLREIGKEKIDELREVVKNTIVQKIEGPIRAECKKFVAEGNADGRGVAHRIRELFAELAENATAAAREVTEATLLRHYASVKEEIDKAFADWANPLETAADAIVERHGQRIERSDRQRRARVLESLQRTRAAAPQLGIPDATDEAAQ